MEEEIEKTDKQHKKQYDWLKQYQWQKGQSGNEKGRPKGKSLKTFVRETLEKMNDEDKAEFLKGLDPEMIWKMGEGNPQTDVTSAGKELPQPILYAICNNDGDQKDNKVEQENPSSTGGNISQ